MDISKSRNKYVAKISCNKVRYRLFTALYFLIFFVETTYRVARELRIPSKRRATGWGVIGMRIEISRRAVDIFRKK